MSSGGFGRRFLKQPDRIGQLLAGPPWGDRSLAVAVAGTAYRLAGLSDDQCRLLAGRLPASALAADSVAPSPTTHVVEARRSDFRRFDTRGWEFSLDLHHEAERISVAGLEYAARLEWPTLNGTVATCAPDGDPFHGVAENHLRVLAAYALLARGGVVVHAAAVAIGGAAALFFGPSGSGKSTVAAAAGRNGLLTASDDLNAVEMASGSARLVALPFARTGSLPAAARLPIAAFFRLRQWSATELRAMAPAEAVAALAVCAPFVNRDPYRNGEMLTALTALVLSVPVYELRFDLSCEIWGPVTAALGGRR